ncbi:MAG: RDD family protein [Bdellovibrio sp.]
MITQPTPHPQPETPSTPPLKREAPKSSYGEKIFNRSNESLDFDQQTGFIGGPTKRKGFRLAMWSFLASFIDLLVLISMTCVFLIVFSSVVKASASGLVLDIFRSHGREMLFAEVFFVAGWLYMVSIRGLMGSTLGEWACDLRLGQPHERLQSGYVIKVALRSTVILLTGIVTLPVLSLLLGRDVPGIVSGLRLFSLK